MSLKIYIQLQTNRNCPRRNVKTFDPLFKHDSALSLYAAFRLESHFRVDTNFGFGPQYNVTAV